MDIIKRKKQREKTQQTEKDILDYGRKKEGIAARPKVDEQMVAPKRLGKRDLLDLTPTEKKLDAIIRLSNRPGVFSRAVTGKRIPGVSEQLTPEQKKDAKLNYQYKQVTDPKRPEDPIKKICLLYTSPSPRDQRGSRMPSSA